MTRKLSANEKKRILHFFSDYKIWNVFELISTPYIVYQCFIYLWWWRI